MSDKIINEHTEMLSEMEIELNMLLMALVKRFHGRVLIAKSQTKSVSALSLSISEAPNYYTLEIGEPDVMHARFEQAKAANN